MGLERGQGAVGESWRLAERELAGHASGEMTGQDGDVAGAGASVCTKDGTK